VPKAITSIDLLTELVQKAGGLSIKNPSTAVSVALLLLHPKFVDQAQLLTQLIFIFGRTVEDFGLTYTVSSDDAEVLQYISALFGFLTFAEPWNKLANHAITTLVKDARFTKVLDRALNEFVSVTATLSDTLLPLAKLMFRIDKHKFLKDAGPEHVRLLLKMIDEIAQPMFDVTLRIRYNPDDFISSAILKIITASAIPFELQINPFVVVVYIISQTYDRRTTPAGR
jgi:hypothetical protein